MGGGAGLAVALSGLGGSRVLTVPETPGEVVIDIETTSDVAAEGFEAGRVSSAATEVILSAPLTTSVPVYVRIGRDSLMALTSRRT